MRPSLALVAGVLSWTTLTIAAPSADYLSLPTRRIRDKSNQKKTAQPKYFHEAKFDEHYDGRFANHRLSYVEQKRVLKNLIQTYLATFSDLGIETWIMHGSLLGWWWNKQILPWDADVDVQVTFKSMHYLASYYNMSVFHYRTPRIPEGRNYMLEINPHYVDRDQSDKQNVIDARWIDTESGLYIDITSVEYNKTHFAGNNILSCKDGHEYRDNYIFPLKDTYFEGVPAKIPAMYRDLLVAEYGPPSIGNKEFNDHIFDDEIMEWVPKRQFQKTLPKS